MKKVFSIILIFIFSSLIVTGCLQKEEVKKDLSELKLDLDPVGLPDQVFSQISCLTAAYNFYENAELTNQEFIEQFGFDLSDVKSWEYDQGIPWEEIEEKLDFNFKHVNYLSDYTEIFLDKENSREKLIIENIDEGNIMMLRVESKEGDSDLAPSGKDQDHTFWLIWVQYKGESNIFDPCFISPLFSDAHKFSDLEELSNRHYTATEDMVIISRKDK